MTPLQGVRCLAAALLLLAATAIAPAANTIHLFLTLNDTVIQGESTETSLGRENSIQLYSFVMGVEREEIGARTYEPIVIRKRVDKSSPLLMKALAQNESGVAIFRFYRANDTIGETEQYHTITLQNVRITRYRQFTDFVLDRDNAELPDLEEITLTFQAIEVVYENGGIAFSDEVTPAVKQQDGLTVK